MRNASHRKPFRILAAAIVTLIAVPAAFAHNHHPQNAQRVAAHPGNAHHRSHNDRDGDSRLTRSRDGDSQTVAALTDHRRHERVPDEEELEIAEQ